MSATNPPDPFPFNAFERYENSKDDVDKWMSDIEKNLPDLLLQSTDSARATAVLNKSVQDRKTVADYYRQYRPHELKPGHLERIRREEEALEQLQDALSVKGAQDTAAAVAKAKAKKENDEKRREVAKELKSDIAFPPLGSAQK